MHGGIEGKTLVRPTEEARQQNEMPTTRDGEHLRDTLHDAQHHRLKIGGVAGRLRSSGRLLN
jgi:hypothetical protein